MSDHPAECDVLEQAESDRTDESCSSDELADTGPASCQHGLYLGPGDDLSCGTHLTLPSTSSSGPRCLALLSGLAKRPLTGHSTAVQAIMKLMLTITHVIQRMPASCQVMSTIILR